MQLRLLILVFLLGSSALPAWAETASALVQKGEAALAAHDAATAMESFDKALELDPKNGIASFERAKILLKINEAKGAIADFTLAIIADPKNAAAYDGRGEAKMKLKQPDVNGALEDFQLGIDAAPEKPDPLLVRASYFVQLGNLAGARQDLEKARALADGKLAEAITKMLGHLN
jgi:Tfp pilus assembly protein PilF